MYILEKGESVKSNFKMYNLHDRYIDVWIGDQMNTALRRHSMFDAIVTDRKWKLLLLYTKGQLFKSRLV